jgi:hypothetical protein
MLEVAKIVQHTCYMCTDHWRNDANGKTEVLLPVVFYEYEILSGSLCK